MMKNRHAPQLKLILENASDVLFECGWDELPDELSIGRSAGNTWQTPAEDKLVSSRHALVVKKGKHLTLRDCGSKNGISDGDMQISSATRMVPGRKYGIGAQTLTLQRVEVKREESKILPFHRLEQLSGEKKGAFVELKDPVVTIGSGKECTLHIPSALVSHVHAHIVADPVTEGYSIYDGADDGRPSSNGTKVNGEAVSPRTGASSGRLLQDGDVISVVYADFRFLDRRVVHVRSHVVLKLMTVLMTLAVLIGGYFAFMSVFPSAKELRLAAENAAHRADFTAAKALIQRSRGARGAEADGFMRDRLVLNIRTWEETYASWYRVRSALAGKPNLQEIEKQLGRLLSQDEGWRWNTRTAEREKASARLTFELLGAMFAVDRAMQADSIDVFLEAAREKKDNPIVRLQTLTERCREAAEKYRGRLLAQADEKLKTVTALAQTVQDVRRTVEECTSVDAVETTLETVVRLRGGYTGRAAAVRKYLDAVESDVRALAAVSRAVAANEDRLAAFDFDAVEETLPPLPAAFSCDAGGSLAACAGTLRRMAEAHRTLVPVFRGWERTFASVPWETLDRTLSETTLGRVLDCDCFRTPRPNMRSNRKPVSDYDSILGVDTFYAWLKTLTQVGGDVGFVYSAEHFVPLLESCRNVYSTFDNWMVFVAPEQDAFRLWLMTRLQEVPAEKNRIREYIAKVFEYRALRNRAVRQMLRDVRASAGTRRGIIAGGIACYLGDTRVSRESLAHDFRELVRKTREIKEADAQNPKLLELAVPGDPSVNEAWRGRTAEGSDE